MIIPCLSIKESNDVGLPAPLDMISKEPQPHTKSAVVLLDYTTALAISIIAYFVFL